MVGSATSGSAWAWGWSVGANLGLLAPMGSARVGVLMGLAIRDPVKACFSQSGLGETCREDGLLAAKVLGISAVIAP